MRARLFLLLAVLLAVPAAAQPPDAIDLHLAVLHNSPASVADWPARVAITSLTMRPGASNGLQFDFNPRQAWPDYTPPGWDGPIQYTVWACPRINGLWHCAGIIQMWRTKEWTGAPILAQWHDWAYDGNRWGEMASYTPRAGEQMAFFLSAGNARKGSQTAGPPEQDVTSVRERSNVVIVALPADDTGFWRFEDAAPTPPSPPPAEPPAVVTPPVVEPTPPPVNTGGSLPPDYVNARFDRLEQQLQDAIGYLHQTADWMHMADELEKTNDAVKDQKLDAAVQQIISALQGIKPGGSNSMTMDTINLVVSGLNTLLQLIMRGAASVTK